MSNEIERVKTDTVYRHERYGDVLVTGIGKMYDEWSLTGPKDDIESGDVIIYFYDEYDGYGAMTPMPISQPADEFGKAIVKELGSHNGGSNS